jgi:hypothetical protein
LVFPEFDESVHLVHHSAVEIDPAYWTVWMACDPHPRTAHAFVWLAVNRDGEMVCLGRGGRKANASPSRNTRRS